MNKNKLNLAMMIALGKTTLFENFSFFSRRVNMIKCAIRLSKKTKTFSPKTSNFDGRQNLI
jgi:hypothetical protein